MFHRWIAAVAVSALGVGQVSYAATIGNIVVTNQSANAYYTVATNGSSVVTNLPSGAQPEFNGLFGAAYDTTGNLFLAEGQGRIFKVTRTGVQSTFVTLPATALPGALVFDKSGNLFTDGYDGNIYKITPAGTTSIFASVGVNALPNDMAMDSNGNLYTANQNSGNSYISKITPGGAVSTFATLAGGNIFGLAIDGSNNVYASTYSDGKVTKITQAGAQSTYAQFGFTQNGSTANDDEIHDIDFSPTGELFVAAARTQRLYRVSPTGVITTYASGLTGANLLAFDPIPEPTSLALLGLAGVMMRRRF